MVELKIGANFGELLKLSIIRSSLITFYDSIFIDDQYSSLPMTAYFNFDFEIKKSDSIIPCICLEQACNIEVFSDAIKVNLPNVDNGRILFYQGKNFGIITNHELQVASFIVKRIIKGRASRVS